MTQPPSLTVRKINCEFSDPIQKHWLDNNPIKTHFLNAMTLVFPDIEEYLVRSGRAAQGKLSSPKLRAELRAFAGQEAQHLMQHKRFFDVLTGQGYRIDWFLKLLRFVIFRVVEPRVGVALNLATAVAGEHITATGSEYFLRKNFVENAPAELKNLFRWHWAEEIEHKSVLFDVLKETYPSYPVRLGGLFISHLVVFFFLLFGTFMLTYQDGLIFNRKTFKSALQFFFIKEKLIPKMMASALIFAKPSFHPSQIHDLDIAQTVFESMKKTTAV